MFFDFTNGLALKGSLGVPNNTPQPKIMIAELCNSNVWVKLSTKGRAHLETWCNQFKGAKCEGQDMKDIMMARFERQDGWFEFRLNDFIMTFRNVFKPQSDEPTEDGHIHFEKPY